MEQASKKPPNRYFWLGLIISVLCILALIVLIDPAEIVETLQSAQYEYVLLSTVCILLFLWLRAIRWQFLLKRDIPWSKVFHIQNIGYMLTMMLPFRLGDLAKVVLIGNIPPVSIVRGVSTMVVERIFDLLFFVILLPFTISGIEQLPNEIRIGSQVAGFITLLGLIFLIFAANQRPLVQRITHTVLSKLTFMDGEKWMVRLDDLLAGLDSLTRWRDGFMLIFWSILIWIPVIYSYYIVMLSVGLEATPTIAAFTTAIAALGVAAPSSPGQIGVFEAAVTLAIVTILGPSARAMAASFAILHHTVQFVMFILIGLIGLSSTGESFRNVLTAAQKLKSNQT